jgi:hypothetical protein
MPSSQRSLAAAASSAASTISGWLHKSDNSSKDSPVVPAAAGAAAATAAKPKDVYITLENLWAGNPLEGMRLKGDLAVQTRDLPNGAQVKLNLAPKPTPG